MMSSKLTSEHLARKAIVYVRQSTAAQVREKYVRYRGIRFGLVTSVLDPKAKFANCKADSQCSS